MSNVTLIHPPTAFVPFERYEKRKLQRSRDQRVPFEVGYNVAEANLKKALSKYNRLSEAARDNLANRVSNIPSMDKMNPGVLAAALVLMYETKSRGELTPQLFSANITYALGPIEPDSRLDRDTRETQIEKLKADVYRYYKAIIRYTEE